MARKMTSAAWKKELQDARLGGLLDSFEKTFGAGREIS